MDEKVQEFLIEVEAAGLATQELRDMKKILNAGIQALVKRSVDPVAKKKNRLEAKLAAIRAELEGLDAPTAE